MVEGMGELKQNGRELGVRVEEKGEGTFSECLLV